MDGGSCWSGDIMGSKDRILLVELGIISYIAYYSTVHDLVYHKIYDI